MYASWCRHCLARSLDPVVAAAHAEMCDRATCGSESWHGTNGGYTYYGCRGPRCREAHAAYNGTPEQLAKQREQWRRRQSRARRAA